MTLILATPYGVYSDRKVSANTAEVCDPVKKCCSNETLVAAFAGDLQVILKAIDAVKEGCDSPKELAKVKIDKITVEGLVVQNNRIYVLDIGKAWVRPKKCGYYAMGSGGTMAMAFLAGRLSRTSKIKDADIKEAFRFVSKWREDCGKGVDFIQAW